MTSATVLPPDVEDGDSSAAINNEKKSRTAYSTQANALLRKNISYQRRNCGTNACLISMPVAQCILLYLIQLAVNALLSGSSFQCGCQCFKYDNSGNCVDNRCGVQYSTATQAAYCAVPSPVEWPVFQQVGSSGYRSVSISPTNFPGLPSATCRSSGTECPVSFLYTGNNQTVADGIAKYMFANPANQSALLTYGQKNALPLLATVTPGTDTYPPRTWQLEPAMQLRPGSFAYTLLKNCSGENSTTLLSVSPYRAAFKCVEALTLWRSSDSSINTEMYDGFYKSDAYPTRVINELGGGYDFRSSSPSAFDVNVFYNNTYANDTGGDSSPPTAIRFARSLNLAADAFVKYLTSGQRGVPLLFIKEYPKPATTLSLNFSALLGPLFFMWLIQLLLPVVLGAVMYEKQQSLRTMMKMHGLGDLAYWSVSYLYFLALSCVYMLFFILCGSAVGLKFFSLNSYVIQLVFYFVYVNNQIAFAFFLSTLFRDVKTATVSGYLYVFGTGLLGEFLFRYFLEDTNFSRSAIFAMEIIPAFSLFRGLYEFAAYSFTADYLGTFGMGLSNLSDSQNGIVTAAYILIVEWAIFLPLAFYLDQVVLSGSGVPKHPLFFLHGWLLPKPAPPSASSDLPPDSKARPDVEAERELVSSLQGQYDGYAIVCDRLRKVFPARDGNPEKYAVRQLSLAIPRGECFGVLGPNGAGKTTSINMMIGFLSPSGGRAVIGGLDIGENKDVIYSTMGVCPQHDLLWEQLTGREHLLFYGRLKNLTGVQLQEAVVESLRSVNLLTVANKRAGQYSGGMKRRLSVAISLIGDPRVVYMDEPSTGLDPASRVNLWNVVKAAKRNRAIVLTTHSMEEAEALCDRIGIFVNGEFECVGNPKSLTARYGGTFVLTITVAGNKEKEVNDLVASLSDSAKLVYSLAGTHKYELPTSEVDIGSVFSAVEAAKEELSIQAWGISNTTLEDVFIKIAKK